MQETQYPEELKKRERLEEPKGLPKGKKCPHYPCHFTGQVCIFCYCPKYPCENDELGKWIKSSKGDIIWTCMNCELIHKRKVARYLKRHPNASVEELQKVAAKM